VGVSAKIISHYNQNKINSKFTDFFESIFINQVIDFRRIQIRYKLCLFLNTKNVCKYMATIHTRTKFDSENYINDVKQSTKPLEFYLDPWMKKSCYSCRPIEPGNFHSNSSSTAVYKSELTDIESSLLNLRCQEKKYAKIIHPFECNFTSKETRMDNPPMTLKDNPNSSWIPYTFDYLCLNPQDPERIFHQRPINIPMRIINKDNFVPKIRTPIEPQSTIDTIPKIPVINNNCNGPYTKSMTSHYYPKNL